MDKQFMMGIKKLILYPSLQITDGLRDTNLDMEGGQNLIFNIVTWTTFQTHCLVMILIEHYCRSKVVAAKVACVCSHYVPSTDKISNSCLCFFLNSFCNLVQWVHILMNAKTQKKLCQDRL